MPSLKRNTVVNNEQGLIIGTGGGPNPGTGGGIGNGGKNGSDGKGGGSAGLRNSKKTQIKSRVYRTNQKKSIAGVEHTEYKLFLSSNYQLGSTDISISQKGDSGNVACFEIGEIKDSKGNFLNFRKEHNSNGDLVSYKIISVSIPDTLKMQVTEPYKSSFKIVKL